MSDDFPSSAAIQAQKLARQLATLESETGSPTRIVFAESCTAGLVAALMGQIPGISQFLCGSMVTYRESAKQQWLQVSQETLKQFTAESIEASKSLALSILKITQEADISAAITGHLGPFPENEPSEKDGKIFVVVARRESESVSVISTDAVQLQSSTRIDRQHESAAAVLNAVHDALKHF